MKIRDMSRIYLTIEQFFPYFNRRYPLNKWVFRNKCNFEQFHEVRWWYENWNRYILKDHNFVFFYLDWLVEQALYIGKEKLQFISYKGLATQVGWRCISGLWFLVSVVLLHCAIRAQDGRFRLALRTRDLRDTGEMLYQLSYEATHWERGQFIEFISPVRSEMT